MTNPVNFYSPHLELVHLYLKLKTNLSEDQINEILKVYRTLIDEEGIFKDEENEKTIKLLKSLNVIKEFPPNSEFYIPTTPLEIYQSIIEEISKTNESWILWKFNYITPLEGFIIREWHRENLEKFKNVANNLIKNRKDDVLICARRLTPFDPKIIADKITEGTKIKILLVYNNKRKKSSLIKKEAKQKLCEIYKILKDYERQKRITSEEIQEYLEVRHSNIGEQLRFMKVGNTVILVFGTIEKIQYDAIIIENDRFAELIQKIFEKHFKNANTIKIDKFCSNFNGNNANSKKTNKGNQNPYDPNY